MIKAGVGARCKANALSSISHRGLPPLLRCPFYNRLFRLSPPTLELVLSIWNKSRAALAKAANGLGANAKVTGPNMIREGEFPFQAPLRIDADVGILSVLKRLKFQSTPNIGRFQIPRIGIFYIASSTEGNLIRFVTFWPLHNSS